MPNSKTKLLALLIFCIVTTGLGIYALGGMNPDQVKTWLRQAGIWAPIVYIVLYTIGTIFLLPSTPLNLSGGAIFGSWWGTLWTSIAALVAAVLTFGFTRTLGRDFVAQRFAGRWEAVDAEIQHGGLFYIFAIRLLPIIPYGLVNFVAGLSSIRFRDYFIGTLLGTVPGILPFVMMGSSVHSLQKGNVWPFMAALAMTGLLVGGATWYRRRRQFPQRQLDKNQKR
jgi:uncharacterized membrane protein YdjX (TVP38/TMEM64 family)